MDFIPLNRALRSIPKGFLYNSDGDDRVTVSRLALFKYKMTTVKIIPRHIRGH